MVPSNYQKSLKPKKKKKDQDIYIGYIVIVCKFLKLTKTTRSYNCLQMISYLIPYLENEFKSLRRFFFVFHIVLIALGKVYIQLFSLQQWVNSGARIPENSANDRNCPPSNLKTCFYFHHFAHTHGLSSFWSRLVL